LGSLKAGAELGGCQGGNCPPKILPGPPVSPLNFSGLFLKVLHRPLTAPLVAKLAPPVAPPTENVWLRPCLKARYFTHYSYKGESEARAWLAFPENTTVYNLTTIIDKNMKPIEHVLLHPICVLSHLMCACKHCNVKLFLLLNTLKLLMSLSLKKLRFHAIFTIKHRHTGRLRNRSGWKKTLSGSLVTCVKTSVATLLLRKSTRFMIKKH